MVFLACIGGILAGLFFALRDGLPWLEARRTGSIKGRGERARSVSRNEDPERFDAMLARRRKGMTTGLLIALAAVIVFAWQVLGLMLTRPAG